MATPVPAIIIVLCYLVTLKQGPKIMEGQKPMDLQMFKIIYNIGVVFLSAYMFHEVR